MSASSSTTRLTAGSAAPRSPRFSAFFFVPAASVTVPAWMSGAWPCGPTRTQTPAGWPWPADATSTATIGYDPTLSVSSQYTAVIAAFQESVTWGAANRPPTLILPKPSLTPMA